MKPQHDLLRVNVRGRVFEVDRGCLLREPGSRLYQLAQRHEKSSDPYYFNRNSQLFEHIVDYYVSGSLHFPHSLCMNAVHDELTYWGLDESHLADCCYAQYKQQEEQQKKQSLMRCYWDFKLGMKMESSRLVRSCDCPLKSKIYLFLEEPKSSWAAWVWAFVVQLMTILSIGVVILETLPSMRTEPLDSIKPLFRSYGNNSNTLDYLMRTMPSMPLLVIEYITGVFLTVELILRFTFSPNKKRFFLKFLNVCDAVSLIPTYAISVLLVLVLVTDTVKSMSRALVILGIARIIRISRLLHLAKNYVTPQIIGVSLQESYRELSLLLVMLCSAAVVFASLLFFAELNIENMTNIPIAIWWAMVTMMTVGYGDYQPVTTGGYFIGCLCSITGLLIIALPTPIIVNNFSRLYNTFQTCNRLAHRRETDLSTEENLGNLDQKQDANKDHNKPSSEVHTWPKKDSTCLGLIAVSPEQTEYSKVSTRNNNTDTRTKEMQDGTLTSVNI